MLPVTRIDNYLAVITNDEDAVTPLPAPVTRIDYYLAYLAGENITELPEPVTRIEAYLAKLCGMDVQIPEDPITRVDFYLAVLNGETVDLPEAVTRIDYYLSQWAEGDLPWATFTGNPLQFIAQKAHALKSAVVEFEPIQSGSGDPSPDNVRPISGWTGLSVTRTGNNVFDKANCGVLNAYMTNGSIVASAAHRCVYIPCKPNTTYTISNAATNRKSMGWTESLPVIGGTYTGGLATETTGANAGYLVAYVYNGNSDTATFQDVLDAIQINLGSTALPYEAYTGQTYTVTWQDEAGTVYGGTIDLTTGVLTVDRAKRTITSFDGAWGATANGYSVYSNQTPKSINWAIALCNQFKKSYTGKDHMPLYSFLGGSGADGTWTFILPNTVTSKAEANAWVSNLETPLEIIYALTTPQTYQLTPEEVTAIVGTNIMFTDGTTLTVEARGEAVPDPDALQSLNILLSNRYYNNGTPDEPTDEEALNIILGGNK